MADQEKFQRFVFPRWANWVIPAVLAAVAASGPYVVLLVGYGLSPYTLNANYQPVQPIPYSHELHVNQLGLDCRYCHTTVEKAGFAAIPPTATCMNCHHAVHKASPKLQPLRDSYAAGMPVVWKKAHDLPDYSYFNHSAHVAKGVSCVECHGRVDRMGPEGVHVFSPLSMGWCLSCHRDPASHIRPADQATNLMWALDKSQEERRAIGAKIMQEKGIGQGLKMTDCSTCHR